MTRAAGPMSTRWTRGAFVLLLALTVAAFCYRLGDAPFLDDPNEAEYAEVAREMVETSDWLSPQLNYILFLNKPPLAYWLIAASDLVFGVNEFAARLPSALAGMAIVWLLVVLATRLYDVETGLLAGFILVATGGFFLEARTVRPDLIMTAGIVGGLSALSRLFAGSPQQPHPDPLLGKERGPAGGGRVAYGAVVLQNGGPLLGLQLSLATGLLAKGMLAIVLPGFVFLVMVVSMRRVDLIARLVHPRAWWLLLLLIGPWHVAMSLKHPGFPWDYVVNQHFLFFFDHKFPRDSVPVSLPDFWAAFALRLFPWTGFAPLAIVAAGRGARSGSYAFADCFVLAWTASVLFFFSASWSRMEHYSIPALPAMALLIARLFRTYGWNGAGLAPRALSAHVLGFAALALSGPFVAPRIVAAQAWLAPIPELPGLAGWTFMLFAGGMVVAAVAAVAGKRRWVAPAIVTTFVAAIPCFAYGVTLLARVNSSAPMAVALRVLTEPGERIVYEAPTEYQNCAGFDFYLRRRLDLLRPPGFIAPPYLQPHLDALFIGRDDLAVLWQRERVFFISDPLRSRAHLDGVVPQPFYIVARDQERWSLTNRPL